MTDSTNEKKNDFEVAIFICVSKTTLLGSHGCYKCGFKIYLLLFTLFNYGESVQGFGYY